jgi:hypothetical protein
MLTQLGLGSRAEMATWAVEHGLGTRQDRRLTTLERLLQIRATTLPGALDEVRPTEARQGGVVTIYEAQVLPEQGAALRQAYAALARGLPPEVIQAFLVPAFLVPPHAGRTAWRLVVTWRSRAAFEAHRDAELLPGFALSGTSGE